MARSYRFTTTLSCGTDGEADYVEYEVCAEYTVHPGCAPSRDDPGSDPEVEITRLLTIDGQPAETRATPSGLSAIEEQLLYLCHDEMLAEAADAEEADRDHAADMRRIDRQFEES